MTYANRMCASRLLGGLLLAMLAWGCRDQTSPLAPPVPAPMAQSLASRTIPILQQAKTAPPLQTYQVSFWAHVGIASTVSVRYQPTFGQLVGDPFLYFNVPKNSLVAGADGVPLGRGDSVYVTLTIDPSSFLVDFQPSGVLFAQNAPAQLALWYGNANLDLNGNGVIDGNDKILQQQLAIWYQEAGSSAWFKQLSRNDTTHTLVGTLLYHFSEYAVSW